MEISLLAAFFSFMAFLVASGCRSELRKLREELNSRG
jgi:hypothetical protein